MHYVWSQILILFVLGHRFLTKLDAKYSFPHTHFNLESCALNKNIRVPKLFHSLLLLKLRDTLHNQNLVLTTDSLQWKKIDSLFLDFGLDSRNLRLGIATNGMNPFGNLTTNHSSWPVLLTIYNLSPWLCIKCKYMILSMMISGPR